MLSRKKRSGLGKTFMKIWLKKCAGGLDLRSYKGKVVTFYFDTSSLGNCVQSSTSIKIWIQEVLK